MDRRRLTPALPLVPVEETRTPTTRRSVPVMPDMMVQEPFQIVQGSCMMLGVPRRMSRRRGRMPRGGSGRMTLLSSIVRIGGQGRA